jgi:metal-sulfur cluster biosynthetic enzyme
MAPVRVKPDRAMQVQDCLATVMDPELDESVTELGFVTEVVLQDEGEVRIGFRLPTYWCAANFAFLMADDMRRAVQALPWVTKVEVHLHDHMYAEAINQGVTDGAGFQSAFGVAAEGGLETLRRTFEIKAFQRRQEALLAHLVGIKHAPEMLVSLDVESLRALALDADGERLVERYLERRSLLGNADLAFVDMESQPIAAATLPLYLRDLRRVGVNAEFNGTLCRGLLAVRDNDAVTAHPIHFVRQPRAVATP